MVALGAALAHLFAGAGPSASVVLPLGLPWLGAHFRVDPLAAFFLAVINLGGAAAGLYGVGYGRHEHEPQRVLPFFPAFLAGMNFVILAADAFTFLLSWEFMSLASWALVMAHHRDQENARAGYVYIVMASVGTFALMLAFGLLAGPDGGYAFETIRARTIPPQLAGITMILVLLGAGSKAGLVPLHVWLPLAHPAAPSHVSALMSGVMTKVAIYGFVRIVFDLLGQPAWWWGVPVLTAGGGTAVLGILYALMQNDLKRVLAYSTIENIGFIFVGLGLALAFSANGLPAASALALTAALFHVLNHAMFKSVLFFGAGAVLTVTGERQMERLGGLIHRMPVTSVVFLIACAAISALPPLNGFVSEWLTFQAILLSPQFPQWGRPSIPAVGPCSPSRRPSPPPVSCEHLGSVLLGRPRHPQAESAHEVDWWSLSAMVVLVALCFLTGVMPGFVIDSIAPVVQSIVHDRMPAQSSVQWLSIAPIAESRSSYNGLLVFLFIASSASIAATAIHRLASHAVRRAPAWDCGFPDLSPATQYSASSFAQPIRRVFGPFAFRARERIDMPSPGELRPARFDVDMQDFAWQFIYSPVVGTVRIVSEWLNPLQFRTIRQYLSLVFFALVSLLLAIALWS